jgi:2-polyprenyl-3-methyl-5-hydroxy-6-metoxy-1,4-benzoquinol methylase
VCTVRLLGQQREIRSMIAANRDHWDDRAELHARSRYYDLVSLRARGPAPIAGPDELEVGPVAGKDLVHLHCHIGTDTLRWAALGARVTGVDFSARSIEVAGALAAEAGLGVRFVVSDVHDLAGTLGDRFDIVYASYGVICWIRLQWFLADRFSMADSVRTYIEATLARLAP